MKKGFYSVIIGILISCFSGQYTFAQFGGPVTVASAPTVEAALWSNQAAMQKLGVFQIQEDWKRFTQDQAMKRAQHAEEMAQHKLSFAKQVAYYADQATAWINQFDKMATQIRTAMSHLNTARGLFGIAAAGLGLDQKARGNLKDWFTAYESVLQATRGAIKLWQLRWSMVSAIKRFQSMPSGFNPQELWGVVNDYVFTVNRERQAEEEALRALMMRDPVLGGLWEQWGAVNRRLEEVKSRIKTLKEKMEQETVKVTGVAVPTTPTITGTPPTDPSQTPTNPSTENVGDKEMMRQIAREMSDLEKEKIELEKQAMELMEKIKKRFEELHVPLAMMAEAGRMAANEANAWSREEAEREETMDKGLRAIFNYDENAPVNGTQENGGEGK